ncbi:MAG: glycosyltransferase family 4 protein [Gammaproteobacteria bacterium]
MPSTHQDIKPYIPCFIASSVKELLSLHDEAFIRCAYATILRRDPDPEGLRHFLARLRNGESRRAILAGIRLSPEGLQRENVLLPGLDHAIRFYRWRRWPLLGPFIRLIGVGKERVDIRRQIAVIAAQLHRLSNLVPPPHVAEQSVKQQTHSAKQQVHTDEPHKRNSTTSNLTWRIKRSSDEDEDLSQTRAEMTRAMAELGLDISPTLPSVDADVTALFASPPLPVGKSDMPTLLVGHDWDESGYPADWVDGFNDNLSGIACASNHTMKVLIDHGVSVPVGPVGLGVDHWERIFASPDYRAQGKSFRFLHVSPCDPSKGIDLLLESFGRVFDSHDDVSLVVKPTGVPPPELVTTLDRLRSANPGFPDVVLIEEKLTDADLKALYGQCHVFVAPSRAEGFGMTIAQAFLSGLPVLATSWGGHLDYCDEANSWLVDYRFQRARTPNDLVSSVWAGPTGNSLDDALRMAYRAAPAERSAKSSSGRKRLMEHFTWKDAALRLVALAERAKAKAAVEPKKLRVGFVTTWNVKCGIATHVEHLVAALPVDEFVIFAGIQEPYVRPDQPNCLRTWTPSKDSNGLGEIERNFASLSIDALVIQFNYSFYNHLELKDFIESVLEKGIVVFVELHSIVDPFGDTENWRLSDFLSALRKCHRILVHGPTDMDRLKALGLVDNVMLLPHGVVNKGHVALQPKHNDTPLIASFGFCFPNKGLLELVEAVSLLKREGRHVRLRMLNAEYPHPHSAQVVQSIKEAIKQLGLQNEVELHTEFLEDEVCLALLREADIIVNPYQSSGESASGAVRYGLTSGRPVTVTPLPIFDDLGDAVFRMPGVTPQEIAQGICSVLNHIKEESETARHVQYVADRWVEAHDYSRQGALLTRIARSLARPQKIARGVFINTAQANCSIYESGRMVYNCISGSDYHTLDYFSLDMLDVPLLVAEGRVKPINRSQGDESDLAGDYDFWVFNWHFITMAPHLDPESIRRLPGRKFTVVLELEPSDPLKLVPPGVFDGYIALDPSAPSTHEIFPFPRPLEGDPQNPNPSSRDVPVIGSFGFGTPGKGFELLVEAVNREFEEAVIRINIPRGTYTGSTDDYHGQDYSKYIASLCRRIAKPGIDVRFTHDFMSPVELVNWCADNDLNCFMYTRRQSGLSATTDQAIMSGRPLLTSSNDTFRHIHQYISPYPVIGLREAIETTAPLVRRLQKDWSRASFNETFQQMLATFGLIKLDAAHGSAPAIQDKPRLTIMVVSRNRSNPDDIFWYPTRVADCLNRSGKYEILRAQCGDVYELEERVVKVQPSAVIVLDFPDASQHAVTAALKAVTGPKILLADDERHFVGVDNGLLVLPRQPVVPYFTSAACMRMGVPVIWLIGFAAQYSNLEEVVVKIGRELPEAELFLEVPESQRSDFETRVRKLRKRLLLAEGIRFSIHTLPMSCDSIINNVVVNNLTIFYNDPDRTQELESASSIAMTTERAIAFTRAATFRHFLDGGTFVEDLTIRDIMSLGMGAQIKLCHEFSEGRLYAMIDRLISEELARVRAAELPVVQVINQ